MIKIKRVAIVGGTHGNEWTGVYLIQKFQQYPELVQRSSFETLSLIANPQAVAVNRRYVDRDLNRCFDRHDLANQELVGYENNLAKEIAARLGANGTEPVDAIIDLHSTTANMGATIIPISRSPVNLRLASHLSDLNPTVRIYLGIHSEQDSPMLRSLAPLGCTVEVGPIAQGILNAHILAQTESLVLAILDYFDQLNQGVSLPPSSPVTIYQAMQTIDYPRNGRGDLKAIIHPDRQGQDYQCMKPGAPLFLDLQGKTIYYAGDSTIFPAFINEAAYYEKGIAMVITEKRAITISSSEII